MNNSLETFISDMFFMCAMSYRSDWYYYMFFAVVIRFFPTWLLPTGWSSHHAKLILKIPLKNNANIDRAHLTANKKNSTERYLALKMMMMRQLNEILVPSNKSKEASTCSTRSIVTWRSRTTGGDAREAEKRKWKIKFKSTSDAVDDPWSDHA